MKEKPILEMHKVKFGYKNHPVLKGIDLSLTEQETLVIMGSSAGGKSTILRLLLGILKADSGSILFKDQEINRLTRVQLDKLRSQMGMVYQYSALLSSMTVRDNVALPLRELSKKTSAEIEDIVDAKLGLVGLDGIKDKMPSELSGGMKKRVGLARALVLEPSLILFDEPSSGLDPLNSVLIDDLIISLREKHKVTSIVVTHTLDSAFRIATRIAMLHEGKIIEDSSPGKFRSSKNAFVKEFLNAYGTQTPAKDSHHENS